MKSFVYNNIYSGLKAQEVLIDFGVHLLSFVDFTDPDLRGQYFEVLSHIIGRGELDLAQVGFTNASLNNEAASKQIKEAKQKLGVKFQYFLYQALKYSMEKLSRKAVDFYKRDFLVLNIAVAYFKVPEFRKAFLDTIKPKGDKEEISELKDVHFDMHDQKDNIIGEGEQTTVDYFFNWNEHFYDKIPETKIKQENAAILKSLMGMKKWEERLEKKGVALFLIISKWATYVQSTVVSKSLFWGDVPGYNIILQVVLSRMKEMYISQYPESLIEATCSLLANEKLLTAMVHILFQKTNIFIPKEVKTTFEIVDRWFQIIDSDGK